MFCSACGHALAAGQPVCPQCGRPAAPVVPPIPGLEFQLGNYADKVRLLSIVWFAYAALSLLLGIAGLSFAHAFFNNHMGPWSHDWGHGNWGNGDGPPEWLGPAILHFVWVAVVVRSGLALIAAWGLYERAQWGRIVAIVVAFLSLLKFPFGTALGIWTLITLMGYRNTALYDQLSWTPRPGHLR